jgi:hypothetical protein
VSTPPASVATDTPRAGIVRAHGPVHILALFYTIHAGRVFLLPIALADSARLSAGAPQSDR